MLEVFVGLGSNLGNSKAVLLTAMREIGQIAGLREIARSGCWLSAPLGGPIQPDYFNAVMRAGYNGTAFELLDHLQNLEARHGRQRTVLNGPRTLDLDILLFGNQLINTPRLVVPHPRLAERAFVLLPLRQLAPDLLVPGWERSVDQLCHELGQQQRIEEITWDICGGHY